MKKYEKLRVLRKTVLLFGLTAFLCGWFFSAKSWAKSLYVSDTTLEAILRSGPDVSYSIIASLPIGTRVTMIKVEKGWVELTLPDGRTGWTLERYLSKNPPWQFTAEKLAKEKELFESQIGETELSNRSLREENDQMEKELASLQQDLESTRDNFEALEMARKIIGACRKLTKSSIKSFQSSEKSWRKCRKPMRCCNRLSKCAGFSMVLGLWCLVGS